MTAWFVPNLAGIADLANDALVQNDLKEIAGEIAAKATEIAPVDSGDYQRSIGVMEENGKVVVEATVPYAIYVEYGGGNNPGEATLRTATGAFLKG
jgi:hypothetical protein